MKSMVIKKSIFWPVLIVCVLLVVAVFVITGVQASAPNHWIKVQGEDPKGCSYTLDLSLDPEHAKLKGVLDFIYVNEEARPMGSLLFMIYPNSFLREDFGAFTPSDMKQAYPNGFSQGSMDIIGVTSQGKPLEYTIKGSQNHELWIELPSEVTVGDRAELKIAYEVTVPNCYGRFGYGDSTWSLVNCHPILAVYEEGYQSYPYYAMGDPFYSEVADYKATIAVPEDYEVAVTGHVDKVKTRDGQKLYTVDAPNRRDFGFVASDAFKVAEKKIGDVTIRSYYFSSDLIGEQALEVGADSIDVFSRVYGEYPYRDFNVVQTNFYIGGMEYPGMVLIDDSMYNVMNAGIMEMIIAHETAHQWWYAQVGNDQVSDPWLDEGLTDFSTALYFEENYKKSGEAMAQRLVRDNYEYMEKVVTQTTKGVQRIDAPTTEYSDSYLYSLIAYGKGAQLFAALREELGDEAFFKALQNYLATYRYQLVDRDDLEKAFEEASGRELTPWFDEHMVVTIG